MSVIIPTFNKFELLKRAVNSAINQNFDNYEIYICDDCSTDYSAADVNQYLSNINYKKIPDINYHRNDHNLGTVLNMNNAIRATNGDLIVQLSGDDFFCDCNVLSEIYQFFCDNKYSICIGKRQQIGNSKVVPDKNQIELLSDKSLKKDLIRQVITNNFISGSTLYYKHDFMIQQGLYDSNYRLIEDYPFILKLISNNVPIGVIDKITIFYNDSGVSSQPNQTLLQKISGIFRNTKVSEFQNEMHKIMENISLPIAIEFQDQYSINWLKEEIYWFRFKTQRNKAINLIKWLPYYKLHNEKNNK